MKRERFSTEAEMCAAFIATAKANGFTPYAETAGWDILLVRGDGTQVGVQAKLAANVKVIHQCIDRATYRSGPDYRVALVSWRDSAFTEVCSICKVFVIACNPLTWKYDRNPFGFMSPSHDEHWRWHPEKRHDLPAYVPDVVAGASAPVQLTGWKIKAIRLCRILRRRGTLTVADFKTAGINRQRWLLNWIDPVHMKRGVYQVRPGVKLPDECHPEVSKQIDAELEWRPS